MPNAVPRYASQGAIRFLAHYVRRRIFSHAIVLGAVLAAVVCAVGSQYAVKNLVDVLSTQHPATYTLWSGWQSFERNLVRIRIPFLASDYTPR